MFSCVHVFDFPKNGSFTSMLKRKEKKQTRLTYNLYQSSNLGDIFYFYALLFWFVFGRARLCSCQVVTFFELVSIKNCCKEKYPVSMIDQCYLESTYVICMSFPGWYFRDVIKMYVNIWLNSIEPHSQIWIPSLDLNRSFSGVFRSFQVEHFACLYVSCRRHLCIKSGVDLFLGKFQDNSGMKSWRLIVRQN